MARKKNVTEGKVEVVEEATDFTKRIEDVEAGKDSFYFRWNGGTIISTITLKYNHVYSFKDLSAQAKVKVIKSYGKVRRVTKDEYQGRAGIVTKSGRGVRDGMTAREISALDFTTTDSEVVDITTVNRAKSFTASDKDAIVKTINYGLPAEDRYVVQEISADEFNVLHKEQITIKANTSIHATNPRRGE